MKSKYKPGKSGVLAAAVVASVVASVVPSVVPSAAASAAVMANDVPLLLLDQPEDDPPGVSGVKRAAGGGAAATGVNGEIARGRDVDLAGMSAYLDFVLGNGVVGHAFVINKDGAIAHHAAGGMARTADDGALVMSVDTRTAVASVTKNITAAATIKALGMANVSLDAPVSPYLPSQWSLGMGFSGNGVTFRQLLTHESGLYQMYKAMEEADKPSWTNVWDGLEFIVKNGALPGAAYKYKNANFALMRVLVPRLWVESGEGPLTVINMANHAGLFLTFLQQYVLEPAGINDVTCSLSTGYDEALYYSFDFVEEGGNLADFLPLACGGNGGLRLSALELARYLAYLEHSTDILTDAQRDAMDDGRLGWSPYGSDDRLSHSGQYFSEYVLPGTGAGSGGIVFVPNDPTYRKETHACVMKLPQAIEVSLVVNSSNAGGGKLDPCGLVEQAFDLYGG